MADPAMKMETESRGVGRSVGALALGFVCVVALSLGTDQVFHSLGIYPPWDTPMNDTGLLLMALTYRTIYGIFGSYVSARFAPHHPVRHALILGAIGFVLSLLGAIATIPKGFGPSWYPLSLVFTALPGAWLGGVLHQSLHCRTCAE